jgi:hypothetical protein
MQAIAPLMAVTAPEPKAEKTFLANADGISVSSSRIVIHNKTYSVANVSSVSVWTEKAPKVQLIPIGLILAMLFALHWFFAFVGLALISIGILIKHNHCVRITSASGETNALESKDLPYIEGIVAAISQAIVHRG